ncbi:ubiquitin-conjugating enzyme E2Q-like protein 1 isoform X1 [Gracilinanus agilis]|uniref:ubiquitin-conjugating enzyme E2Q-like protein 1 isoform X1 n=1 Tax=Gracilinanus agilis TaxID=191870 RepID=UPI001CFE474A|nr:ubiquitin-conjugating enzyme E2Q-like protein 1 isoform X1 [Gracilinanus agilis]
MATLLRKIGLIRLHNRDTEDPKHHHNHLHSSSQHGRGGGGGSSLRGKGNQKNHSNKQQQNAPGGVGGCSGGSGGGGNEGSPGHSKNKRALELANKDKQQQQQSSSGGHKEKQASARENQSTKESKQQPGGGGGGGRSGGGKGSSQVAQNPAAGSLAPIGRGQPGTQVRSRRLMKELQDISRLSDRFISVELVDESLYDWNVKLHQVDKDSVLWQDMKETNTEFILLNLTFPDNFPFSPPFMRVLSPRLENGYVLDGGAICMELLTPRGWSSAYTVEAVMRQFAASLVKGQGRICRKAGKSKKSFSRKEAEATFKSLVKTHEKYGWVTPPVSDG